MQPFVHLTGIAVPLEGANIDTDRIVPGRFLRKPRTHGFGGFLFHDVRGPGFPLDDPAYAGASVLVADANFGCGSSREGAVWALADAGLRVIVAPSMGDIFYTNCTKNGVLPVRLPADVCARIRARLTEQPGLPITADLPRQVLIFEGTEHPFDIDAFKKKALLEGLDDIDTTLLHSDAIEAWEAENPLLA